MDCSDHQQRFTRNNDGAPNRAKICRGGFASIQGREQSGVGIINTRMKCKGEDNWSDSNRNHNGLFNDELHCGEKAITGVELIEQVGFGIINFRTLCTEIPDCESVLYCIVLVLPVSCTQVFTVIQKGLPGRF